MISHLPVPSKRPKLFVYCDESCIGHKYLTLGTSFYEQGDLKHIAKDLEPCVGEFKSEIKWSKITDRAEDKYKSLVNAFFALNKAKLLHYHCMFADSHKFKHAQFKATDEDTFYKLYYNLLTYRVSQYGRDFDIHVFMDERQTSYSLSELQRILNLGAQKRFGFAHSPYKRIEPIDSKKSKVMQSQDVVLGGMATRKNDLQSTRESKINLSQHIFSCCGVKSYDVDTASRSVFSIWNFVLK